MSKSVTKKIARSIDAAAAPAGLAIAQRPVKGG